MQTLKRSFALFLLLSLAVIAAYPASARASGASRSASSNATTGRAKMLLKVGAMKTDAAHQRLSEAMSVASRQALGELPGVRLLDDGEDVEVAATKRKPPVILITGKLLEFGQTPEGENVVVSAKVEYFVHRMPGQSIAAVISGSAKAKVAAAQVKKRRSREKLESDLVAAAVESAVKRSAPALHAAAN